MSVTAKSIFILLVLLLSQCGGFQDRHKNVLAPQHDLSENPELRAAKAQGRAINDFSDLLSHEQVKVLDSMLYGYEAQTTRQIVLVTMDSIRPYDNIQQFAVDLGKYWGVGQQDKDNGLIVVLSRPLRQVGIATGYGTEKVLTDSICKVVIDAVMVPEFQRGNYYEGLQSGVLELIRQWGGPMP